MRSYRKHYKHPYKHNLTESVWWNILWLTIGGLLLAIGVQSVTAPHGFLSGGFIGLALLTNYWTGTLSPLLWYALLCFPIYILGWFFVGKRFLLYTVYGTLCSTFFSLFIHFQIPVQDNFYAAVVGGVINGTACGIMLRTLGSAGGSDIIAVVLKERLNFPIGQFNIIFNAILFLLGAYRLSFDLVIVSIIMVFISSHTLEYVLGMFNRHKLVIIISKWEKEICSAILARERYGATLVPGHGACSGTERNLVFTVTTNVAIKRLENLVYGIDPKAIFIVENTFYVAGAQFKRHSR